MQAIDLGHKDALDPSTVGHKAANLARFAASFRVPPAFCLSTSVYDELKAALEPDGSLERAALRLCIAQAYERLAARIGTRDPLVAVRSSATGEDSADASFAGQHETILNVSGTEAIVEAVLECWMSAGSERVTAYRKEKAIDTPVQVAVLIQQMVNSDVSAIAFGIDPVSGDQDVVVIDAARGLGDKIAAGDITPDRYVVRKSDLGVTGPALGALDEVQARAVAKLVLALGLENGHDVDVECAFANDELYLLQCRPITTLANAFPVDWRDPADAKLHWRRDDAHMGGPVPRLNQDAVRFAAATGLRMRAEMDDLPAFVRFEFYGGRSYVAAQRRRPEGDLAEHQRGATARVRARARGFRNVWDLEFVPRLHAHYAWMAALRAAVPTLPLGDLADRWDEAWPRVSDIWTMHMLTTGAAYTIMDELAETHESLTGGTTADALKLTQARAPSLQRLGRDMHALVKLYSSSRGEAFERARAAFVAEHGNLGSSGEDLRERPWADDPALLLAELERRAAHDEEDPDARVARLIGEGDVVEERARAALRDRPEDLARYDEVLAAARAVGPLTEEHNYVIDRQSNSNVGRIVRRVGERMQREGLIAEADDVWLFHTTEISAGLRDSAPLHALARERAPEYARWCRLRHPKSVGAAPPATLKTPSMSRVDLNFRAEQNAAGVITGVPASSGVRRGRAKLIRSLADFPKMTKGDVLVCRSSNVSWIPLFTIAAAVVTDVGGSLSHAAVVAREFGVPAVVGCDIALATLRDGELVEVDGDRGTVRQLSSLDARG